MDNLTPITREEMLLNDEPLTPITREEKILAGEDLNPVTRREYFLKKYRHAGGEVMVEGLSVTANGIYTAPEGKAYSPVNVAVPLPENAYLLKEASGSLVSFSDGADLPMPSFICNIDAVQDLHGYDYPWVGGAGKNKQMLTVDSIINANGGVSMWSNNSRTINDVTFTILTDSDGNVTGIKTNGTSSATFLFNFPLVDLEGIYTITGCPAGGSDTSYRLDIRNSSNGVLAIDKGNGGTTASFQDSVNSIIRIENNTALNNLIFYPMIRESSQPSGFAPYSNICPISGHTGVEAVISPTTEASDGTTYSVSWQTEAGEVYGGEIDLVSGELTVTDGYIASYNGETLPSTWISDRDTYAEGTSPTTGAEVVYKLANPQTYQLDGNQIKSLLEKNNAWCSTGDVNIDYFTKEV